MKLLSNILFLSYLIHRASWFSVFLILIEKSCYPDKFRNPLANELIRHHRLQASLFSKLKTSLVSIFQ